MSEPRCEVVLQWNPITHCDKPAVAWYPAYRGGRMDLCEEHAAKHAEYLQRYDDARNPESNFRPPTRETTSE
jgi:hypothetical protein